MSPLRNLYGLKQNEKIWSHFKRINYSEEVTCRTAAFQCETANTFTV